MDYGTQSGISIVPASSCRHFCIIAIIAPNNGTELLSPMGFFFRVIFFVHPKERQFVTGCFVYNNLTIPQVHVNIYVLLFLAYM